MFFDNSTPKRQKAARKRESKSRLAELVNAPVPQAEQYEYLTQDELATDRELVFDTESYGNYWLCAFQCLETNKVLTFELTPDGYFINGIAVTQNHWQQLLGYVLYRFKIVGFNSESYDIPMIQLALRGHDAKYLFECSHRIISNGMTAYDTRREFSLPVMPINHVDLFDVAPLQASLKIYAGRLHCKRMQDLPFPVGMILSQSQAKIVCDYCVNDLASTALLRKSLSPQLALRESLGQEYGQDLRSHSDAQIAEAVIGSELEKLRSVHWDRAGSPQRRKIEAGWQFQYRVPEWLAYKTPQLQAVLEAVRAAVFTVGNGGYAEVPDSITGLRIALGGCVYRMGGGGLHSSEECAAHRAGPSLWLIDRDVASYYPAIILNQGLYPSHLGPAFLEVYRAIVNRRLKAKLEKNKVASEGLKITINGTFGKLGNFYSKLYAPDLLMQVTISGQLCLLLLIEMVELAGISVVSANTDGIVIACPPNRYAELEQVIHTWEDITGFNTEETRYSALYSRDVNNYIAVKEPDENGKIECKTKGIYSEVGSALNSPLSKNPECHIISEAVQAYVAHNTPLAQTIWGCTDIRKFVAVRTVKGGAEKNGVYLGKAIRWYYAEAETGTINYVESGNMVPKTLGARPLMILPQVLPNDLDRNYYLREAEEALFNIGCKQRPKEASLF